MNMADKEKVSNALAITDMIVTMLVKIFVIVQERRSAIKRVEEAGGEISEADWQASDAKFDQTLAAFEAAVNDMKVDDFY
jgi:hypothetical protein